MPLPLPKRKKEVADRVSSGTLTRMNLLTGAFSEGLRDIQLLISRNGTCYRIRIDKHGQSKIEPSVHKGVGRE